MENKNEELNKIQDEYVLYFFEGQFNSEDPNHAIAYPFIWPLKEDKDGKRR